MYKFQSVNDAIQRLRSTVVIYRFRPVYVLDVGQEVISVRDLLTGEERNEPFEPSGFTSPRLGYVNYPDRCTFVRRRPTRRVRQGLCQENICTENGNLNAERIRSRGFGEMLTNTYPDFKTCWKKTVEDSEIGIRAFSRNFAVTHTRHLCYQGQKVGRFSEDQSLTLDKPYTFLKELFDAEKN